MKPLATFFRLLPLAIGLAFCVSGLTSCKTTGPQTPVQVAISSIVNCSATTISHDIPDVITDATTALATLNYVAALTDLAVKFGGDVVACAVRQVNGEAMARYAASGGTAANQAVIAAHAKAYLVGVTFAN